MNPTIIIPFYNGHAYIERLLDTLPKHLRVVIVDDVSDPPLHLTNRIDQEIKLIRLDEKGYFAGAVNVGMHWATQTWGANDWLILNQDVYFTNDAWLTKLRALPARVGVAGDGVFGHPAWPMGYVQGTFMLIRRECYHAVGFLNARDYPLWGGTLEYQLRAVRKGWQADPMQEIPGFVHSRTEEGHTTGSSIRQLLTDQPHLQGVMIRTPPLVSVIIPCFNHGQFLTDAVRSILNQTLQSTEIIIVDDASTDTSAEIGRALANDWAGIRFIQRETNGGTPAANNTGIAVSYGKYITILCADDMREPGSLERLYRALVQNPHHIAYDDVILQFENRQHIWEMHDYDFDDLLVQNFIHAGIMFPKKAWEEIGGYPEKMVHGREDWAMNVGLGRLGYCGVHVKTPGYIYRRHKSNRTLTNTTDEWKAIFRAQLQELYPDVYAGVKPMGCCGQNRPVQGINPQTAQALVGVNGMTLLEYQGGNFGNETYYGPVTGARYVFSAASRVHNVAQEDAPGMLDMYENGHSVFKQYTPPAPAPQEDQTAWDTAATIDSENLNAPEPVAKPANAKPARATARKARTA